MSLVKHTIATIVTVTFVTTALAAESSAEDNWRVHAATDEGVPVTIVSGTDSTIGALITCKGGILNAAVGMEAGDMAEAVSIDTERSKRRTAWLTVADDEPYKARWNYMPRARIAVTTEGTSARKLYNAAIRSDTVTWNASFTDPLTLQMPPMNDVFKGFAANCSVTNGS